MVPDRPSWNFYNRRFDYRRTSIDRRLRQIKKDRFERI
jgi:hypothetical protein